MRRILLPVQLLQRCAMYCATSALMTKQTSPIVSSAVSNGDETTRNNGSSSNEENGAVAATSIAPGPYRCIGNIFIVHCDDHPFKHSWEINRMLRELRLEFKGQTTIVPDVPEVRKRLWRVRHVVQLDMLDLDEAKALIGVPEHISFNDLASQLPTTFGRIRAVPNPLLRSKMNFMRLRRMRLRDVLSRDTLELRLLEEKRKALAASQQEKEKQQQPLSND